MDEERRPFLALCWWTPEGTFALERVDARLALLRADIGPACVSVALTAADRHAIIRWLQAQFPEDPCPP